MRCAYYEINVLWTPILVCILVSHQVFLWDTWKMCMPVNVCVCVCTLRCWSCRRSSSSCLLLFSISVCFFLFSCYDIHALRLVGNAQMHITKIRNRNNIIILKNNMNYIFIYAVLVWQLGNFGNFK